MVTEVAEIIIRERGASATSTRLRRIGAVSRNAAGGVRLLTAALAGVGLALGGRELVQAADTFTRLSNRVRIATQDTGDFQGVLDQLTALSNRTRTSLEANAGLFQRLSIATSSLGTSNAELLQVIEDLNTSLRLSGTSSEEARAGLTQLGQALASGRLQGDELRTVFEALPTVAQGLAAELGVTTGELRELGAQGQLTADVVFPALQRALRDFASSADSAQFTVSETANVLRNEFILAVGEVNNTLGGTTGLNELILFLAENLREILLTTVGATVEGFGLLAEGALRLRDAFNAASIFAGDLLGAFRETQLGAARLRRSIIQLDVIGAVFDLEDFTRVNDEIKLLEQQTDDWAAAQREVRIEAESANDTYAELVQRIQDVGRGLREAAGQARTLEEASTATRGGAGAGGGAFDASGLLGAAGAGAAAGGQAGVVGEITEPFQSAFAASFAGGLRDGFASAIRDGTGLQGFADAFERASQDALVRGLEGTFDSIESGLNSAFEAVADSLPESFGSVFGELGEGFGEALSGVLSSVALAGISALLGGGGGSQSARAVAGSAVTSTQAVRGIVTGPQSIAIANVGDSIGDALEPATELLGAIFGETREIRLAVSSDAPAPPQPGTDLAALAFDGGAGQST